MTHEQMPRPFPQDQLQPTGDESSANVYLEIGSWYDPAVADSTRTFEDGDAYVSLELNQGDYHDPDIFDAQRSAVGHRADSRHMMFTEGDARSMPYPDGSVHEVFMGNVLPAVPYDDIVPMLREAHRVMDGSGPLIMDIGDSDVEVSVNSYFRNDFYDDLTTSGFVVSAVLRSTGPDIPAWRKLRSAWPSVWPGDHVLVVAQKAPEGEPADVVTPDSDLSAETGQLPMRVESSVLFPIDAGYVDSDHGVPQELVDDITADLFDELERRNVNIEDVLFSGYNGLAADPDAEKRASQTGEEEAWPTYFLSPSQCMGTDESESNNPIHFAGTTAGATIAVYDRRKLARLSNNPSLLSQGETLNQADMDGIEMVMPLEVLNQAKVLEYHPRYQPRQQ